MIIVLGADGYTGYEYCTHNEAIQIDNLSKRLQMEALNLVSLNEKTPRFTIQLCDMTDSKQVDHLIRSTRPEAVIHLAENPSAPYSMMSPDKGREVISNNIASTMNLIYAVRDYSPETHIIKLGSMGTYGCPNVEIPEGWFDLEYKGRNDKLLFPSTPHSIYHLSKVMDSQALAFSCRMWRLKVTDLHQGFVHSVDLNDPSRFCYDHIFGTVLNRFLVQAVAGHPLTVYGQGGQTRGLIHIKDTIQCFNLAIENPPKEGEYRVANQLTEWLSINQIAQMVKVAGDNLNLNVKIDHIKNPRIEKEDHFYNVEHKVMNDYGYKGHHLTVNMIEEMLEWVSQNKEKIEVNQILPRVSWR